MNLEEEVAIHYRNLEQTCASYAASEGMRVVKAVGLAWQGRYDASVA